MNTVTICVSNEDAALVHELANLEGVTTSDFAHTAVLEKIEGSYGLHELRVAIAADGGQRFSIGEILEEL